MAEENRGSGVGGRPEKERWLSQDGRFWLGFWSLAVLLVVAVVVAGTYYDYRSELLRLQSPVVETCVHHRVNQRVVVQ